MTAGMATTTAGLVRETSHAANADNTIVSSKSAIQRSKAG